MPKQLMQSAIDSSVSSLAEFHSSVALFSESQVCQMASASSFLYVLSLFKLAMQATVVSVDLVFECVWKAGGWVGE